MVLNLGGTPPQGCQEISRGHEFLRTLQRRKFLNGKGFVQFTYSKSVGIETKNNYLKGGVVEKRL